MRALIKDFHADDKGRAVLLVVADCSAAELRQRLSAGPANVELITRSQLQAQPPATAATTVPGPIPAEDEKGGKLSQWLAARERDQSFQRFLTMAKGCNATTPALAESAVKELLRFTSRKQLDNDPDLGVRFRNEIMLEYAAWLNKRK